MYHKNKQQEDCLKNQDIHSSLWGKTIQIFLSSPQPISTAEVCRLSSERKNYYNIEEIHPPI